MNQDWYAYQMDTDPSDSNPFAASPPTRRGGYVGNSAAALQSALAAVDAKAAELKREAT